MFYKLNKKWYVCIAIILNFFLISCEKTNTAEAKDNLPPKQSQVTTEVTKNSFSSEQISALDEHSIPDTFLWKIEKEGQPTSYLLGTIHIGKENQLPKHVKTAFAKTDVLVTESLLDDPSEMQVAMDIFDIQGTPLSEKIGQERFNLLINNSELKKQGLTPESLEMIKPWGIIMLLMYHQPEGYTTQMGMDMLLVNAANAQSKSKLGLEKFTDQVIFFTGLSDEKVLSLLDNTLNHAEKNQAASLKLAQAYEQNKASTLYRLSTDEKENYEDFPENERAFWKDWAEDGLLYGRNQKWIPIMTSQLSKQSSFIGVGSAHLYGEKGIINLLRAQGYTLTPVMPE